MLPPFTWILTGLCAPLLSPEYISPLGSQGSCSLNPRLRPRLISENPGAAAWLPPNQGLPPPLLLDPLGALLPPCTSFHPPRRGRQGAPQLLWPPQPRCPRPPACGFVSVELITPSHATCPSCPPSQPAAICVFTLSRVTP